MTLKILLENRVVIMPNIDQDVIIRTFYALLMRI